MKIVDDVYHPQDRAQMKRCGYGDCFACVVVVHPQCQMHHPALLAPSPYACQLLRRSYLLIGNQRSCADAYIRLGKIRDQIISMPFKNKYLKYALMDEAADIEDERLRAIAEDIAARAARERRIARSVKQPTIKSPPVPPQAAPPNIAVLGKDRDITMYPTGTAAKHVSTRSLERMEAINDSIWRIDAWLKEWRDAAKKYLSYDEQTQESVPDLLAELVWPNSAVVENLGSAEDLKLLAKLRKIAASKYPGMHMEGAKQLKGFTRLVLVNKEISGNPAEWPNELLDKFNDPDAVGLEDIWEMAVIMAWLEKVLPSMVRQNNAARELYRRIVSRTDDLIPFNRPDKLAWTKTGDYNDLAEHLVGERLSGSGFASKLCPTAANAYRKTIS